MNYVKTKGPTCPKCKRVSIKLVPLNDDGSGEKICVDCKRIMRDKI